MLEGVGVSEVSESAKIVENGRYGALFTRLAPVVVVVRGGCGDFRGSRLRICDNENQLMVSKSKGV